MVRGWRNDPAWVAYYEKRDRDRLEREIERYRQESARRMEQAYLDDYLSRIKEARCLKSLAR